MRRILAGAVGVVWVVRCIGLGSHGQLGDGTFYTTTLPFGPTTPVAATSL
jgi:hypothetical protein